LVEVQAGEAVVYVIAGLAKVSVTADFGFPHDALPPGPHRQSKILGRQAAILQAAFTIRPEWGESRDTTLSPHSKYKEALFEGTAKVIDEFHLTGSHSLAKRLLRIASALAR